ncbi:5-methyltetrahydropteroyltriglutamate-- homocysteine methyltransferase [Pseudomonas sp. R5-89-07]|nr:5-methyltetrahydropteroyltriglutamate-- homocysteine methyltransferase [Pseudomonas sp. R5-89-07]
MAVAHSLGFSRFARDRELKGAQEAFWNGKLDEAGLRAVGRDLRQKHWALQKQAGIELLPVGDFAWHDQVLTHSLMFGVIPERFRPVKGHATLRTLFDIARDTRCGDAHASWFDTSSDYRVPEFSVDQRFHLGWDQLFEEVQEARGLGHTVKPVVIGPLTYLWLGKAKGCAFDKLDLLERLLPLYGQIFQRLAELGVEWVQIDEPILALQLPQAWKNAFERAYNLIQRDPLKKLVATYFGGLEENLGLAANLPVDGLHIDLVRAPEQYPTILDRLPAYKVLSLGVVDGCNPARCDPEKALATLQRAHEKLADRLWVAPSCSLLYGPVDPQREDNSWLTCALQTCAQVAALAQAVDQPRVPSARAAGLRVKTARPALAL